MTPDLNRAEAKFFLTVLGFAAVTILFGHALEKTVELVLPPERYAAAYLAMLIATVAGLSLFYLYGRKRILTVVGASVVMVREPAPARFLIMGMSKLEVAPHELHGELRELGAAVVASDKASYLEACSCQRPAPREPLKNAWQQNLRAAWYHRQALEEILVLDNGLGMFEAFSGYLKAALAQDCPNLRVNVISHPQAESHPFSIVEGGVQVPADYENYRYCDEGIRRGLQMIAQRLADADIDGSCCIDVTAGQKTFSVAAGAVTFNRDLAFSYANNEGRLSFYNARLILRTDHTFLPA